MLSPWYKRIIHKSNKYIFGIFLALLYRVFRYFSAIALWEWRCAYYQASKERSLRESAQNRSYAKEAFLYRELLKPALRLPETTIPVEGIPMHYRISRRA